MKYLIEDTNETLQVKKYSEGFQVAVEQYNL